MNRIAHLGRAVAAVIVAGIVLMSALPPTVAHSVSAASTTVVTSDAEPSVVGQEVTFTASVSAAAGAPTPTGRVQFQVGRVNQGGPVTLDADGSATLQLTFDWLGAETVGALYLGSPDLRPSHSSLLHVTRKAQASVAVSATPDHGPTGTVFTLTATVDAQPPGARGRLRKVRFVRFVLDGVPIGPWTKVVAGQATLALPIDQAVGEHQLTAIFHGDGRHLRSSSPAFLLTIDDVSSVDLSELTPTSTPDNGRQTTATIGLLGGTVETDAADGTHYKLVIPAGALDTDTDISMAPTAVSGLDEIADNVLGAVQFGPSGLVFSTPAELVVTLPAAPSTHPYGATFDEGTPGVGVPLATVAGASVTIPIAHFSVATLLTIRTVVLGSIVNQALQGVPDLDTPQLRQLHTAYGTPGSPPSARDALAQYLLNVDATLVDPAVVAADQATADDPLSRWAIGGRLVAEFGAVAQAVSVTGTGSDIFLGTDPTNTIGDVYQQDVTDLQAKGASMLDMYTDSSDAVVSCSGPVGDVMDWLIVPVRIESDLALISGAATQSPLCLSPDVQTLTPFPSTVDSSVPTVTAEFRGVIVAPPQTPSGVLGGTPSNGHMVFAERALYDLNVTGGTFDGPGGTSLQFTSHADGILDVTIDRPVDATQRGQVVLSGSAAMLDIGSLLHDYYGSGGNGADVRQTTGPSSKTNVVFQSAPVNAILQYGGTSNLCVHVTDQNSQDLPSVNVDWSLVGPGDLASPTSATGSNGIACVDYHHPTGLVIQGDTAAITAAALHDGDTGHDSVTLTPDWASIEIETSPSSTVLYSVSTNRTVTIRSGDIVDLRVTVTGPGATPADPPLRRVEFYDANIQAGGGDLVTNGDPGPQTGSSVLLLPDPTTGQATFFWDPAGTPGGATIAVTYPSASTPPANPPSNGVAATVTFELPSVKYSIRDSGGPACVSEIDGGPLEDCFSHSRSEDVDLAASAQLQSDGSLQLTFDGTMTDSESRLFTSPHRTVSDSYDFNGTVDGSTPDGVLVLSPEQVQVLVNFMSPTNPFEFFVTATGTETGNTGFVRYPNGGRQSVALYITGVTVDTAGRPTSLDFSYSDTAPSGDNGTYQFTETGMIPVD